eukprot:scaffold84580_cov69-Phaeocystis_antarctica.AAC.5
MRCNAVRCNAAVRRRGGAAVRRLGSEHLRLALGPSLAVGEYGHRARAHHCGERGAEGRQRILHKDVAALGRGWG